MKYLHALKQAIFSSALLHIGILVLISIKEKNIHVLNYFNILDLEYFFPRITNFTSSFLISVIVFALLILFFYFRKPRE